MSTSEPFMPAHWPSDRDRARNEIDIDGDVDVLPQTGATDDDQPTIDEIELPENHTFRIPTPGDALSAEELRADLAGETGDHTPA